MELWLSKRAIIGVNLGIHYVSKLLTKDGEKKLRLGYTVPGQDGLAWL